MYTRGLPYSVRGKDSVVVSHGLWSGALDLDGKTETKLPNVLTEKAYPPIRQVIPEGQFFPMCSMNLAFKRDVVPLMYFPLMGFDPHGTSWGYDRFDDIWCGLLVKKICDHLGLSVVNGSPMVEHRKASLPKKNREKEEKGLKKNETVWKSIASVSLTQTSVTKSYIELVKKVRFPALPYFRSLKKAAAIWSSYF
jgi:reversibly glycosylated polypeptide/UDP-arabinopyranose mutase